MLALLAVSIVVGLWWVTRSRELFRVVVRRGKVTASGRIPRSLLNDFAEIVRRPEVARAVIRAVSDEHGAYLAVSGQVDEGRKQRMRNVFALYPASQLRSAPAIKKPTLGQLAGIAWLASFFDRR
jgi:hypothetical protein